MIVIHYVMMMSNSVPGLKSEVRQVCRVTLVVELLDWVDFYLRSSSDWWAAALANYCHSRKVENQI